MKRPVYMVWYVTARNVDIFRYISFISKSVLEPLSAAFDLLYFHTLLSLGTHNNYA